MLGAGLGWLSYRLYTEISVQDWHWNPRGRFSEGNRGYWMSSPDARGPLINDSYQYALPHRGSTFDQGNNASYSRIDDGDRATYWKSNPYLTSPQWIVVDLGRARTVDTIRIDWGNPYARHAEYAYWTGADAMQDPGHGTWRMFSPQHPVRARFIRVLMSESSKTCDTHGQSDWRNCTGYAIREIAVGRTARGRFTDFVRHRRDQRQTAIYASSTDPWHAQTDRVNDQEQPGLDLIARSGLTRGLGGTYAVPMLYSTPENAVAEVRYLRERGYAIRMLELGEEPDGQYVTPEDDAALFIRWARALHAYDPSLKLGGPVFSGTNDDIKWWPDARGNTSWLNRYLSYLRARGALGQLAFMSFEHYPFDGCEHGRKLHDDLLAEPGVMRHIAGVWRADGLPASIPMYVTEANFSAVNFTQTPMTVEGALWLADYFASAVSSGVSGVVYYQYEPVPISQNAGCPRDWGNLTMFVAGHDARIRQDGAQYAAAQMLTQQWAMQGDALHRIYAARGTHEVSAYALKRPDATWSVLLVNKSDRAQNVAVRLGAQNFSGTVTIATFGQKQYMWHARGALSYADPDRAPAISQVAASDSYRIPPLSITVLRGRSADPAPAPAPGAPVRVHVDLSHPVAVVRPLQVLGTGVDSDPRGKIELLYATPRVRQMLAAGLGGLTYRLYTELSIQDWHWNPAGTYSNAAAKEGYWTSSASLGAPIVDSFGYRLPHRGSTHDQGDDDGYSRIDDGDPSTYWKSNPYLTSAYTGQPDAAHPQWVIVQLESAQPIDAIRIAWTNPYATRFTVQYWQGDGDAILAEGDGTWRPFQYATQQNTSPGVQTIRLSDAPVTARWVRVLLSQSSNTCDTHGASDRRNCVGYAVQDIGLGRIGDGNFVDYVKRSKDNKQTAMWTSSDDPWHREADRVSGDQDQPGLDVVSTSGVTRGLPTIYPVPLFYSTPENAANEVRYLESRGYPIRYIEMGEEIDGQYAVPEDYAALYIEFARAIHAVDPRVKLGGPIFSGFNTDWTTWRDASGRVSWLARFLAYLRARGHLSDLAFFSFEHYPFHACDNGDQLQDDLVREPELMRGIIRTFRDDGLPPNLPMLITESNFSADGSLDPENMAEALWMGDWAGSALTSGISFLTYYQYEAEPLRDNRGCPHPQTYGLFLTDAKYRITGKAVSFYAAQILTQEWLQTGNAPQALYGTSTSLGNSRALVTAYIAKRAEGTWSVLLDNKDFVARTVTLPFAHPVAYASLADGAISHASLRSGFAYVLPARSLSVIRFAR
jgi:hypothetical protein